MSKRVILSAGGTGGHLFPAQNLAHNLQSIHPDWELLFVAGGLGSNRYFDHATFPFEEIECATFSFSKPLQVVKGCAKIYKGVGTSRKVIRDFKPDLVVGFGSFFTLPVLIAAMLEKIPFILHEQNAIPGKVNRLFSQFAKITTITFPMTRELLKGKARKEAVEVLFPMLEKKKCQEEAYGYFGLKPFHPTLLVFGGSQGAVRLNALVQDALSHLPSCQILHFAGNAERADELKKHYEKNHIIACVKPFEPHMDLAMQIADFCVARAGAATVTELIEYELPALLIPYPHAAENHQEKNASYFVSIVKGGTMYKEKELTGPLLAKGIQEGLATLKSLKKNIATHKEERKAKQLSDVIKDLYDN